jgi:hypothetical protein
MSEPGEFWRSPYPTPPIPRKKEEGGVCSSDTLSITLVSGLPIGGLVCSNMMVEHFLPWLFLVIVTVRVQDSRCMPLGWVFLGSLDPCRYSSL